jgi:hypothetical protein
MERLLKLALNKFNEVPATLKHPASGAAVSEFNVNLASVYHHYYLDTHGCVPPDPDPAHFEPVRFLAATDDFRFLGNGLGVGTMVRRNRSSELGGAFCRMFLHDHLGITYFEHVERVLSKSTGVPFNGLRLERTASGDIPDYLCASSPESVFLAEAKGRYDSISFKNKEFNRWRKQFTRVVLRDSAGEERPVKGFIVATRWATESGPSSVTSTLFAEDPVTSGNRPLSHEEALPLGREVVSRHYASIAAKLDQPILAAALSSRSIIPPELRLRAVVWELLLGPMKGRHFVGGYFSPPGKDLDIRKEDERYLFGSSNPFRLGSGRGTFFGLEESIFRAVVLAARSAQRLPRIPLFQEILPFYSAVSILRDGSILAPVELFAASDRFAEY